MQTWESLEKGSIKINMNATFNKKLRKAGWGIVARDDKGRLIATWAVPRTCSRNVKMEEVLAIRKAMEIATLESWKRVEFESDCKEIVDKIAKKDWNDKWFGTYLKTSPYCAALLRNVVCLLLKGISTM